MKCIGAKVWPCDHEEKHRAAAKLGWSRRRGLLRVSTSDAPALARLGIRRAHTDREHKGIVRFQEKSSGKWYELPKATYRDLVKATRVELRDESRARRQEAAARTDAERELHLQERAQHAEVAAHIRASGYIRPSRADSTGRRRELEEWREIPAYLRRKTGRVALDDIATEIGGLFPATGVQNGEDLREYLRKASHKRRNRRAA